jgi:uncharacterized protein (TIGR02452 family)
MFNPKDRGRELRGKFSERSGKGKKKPDDSKKIKFNDPEMVKMQEIYEDTKDYLRDVKQVHYVGTRFEKDTICFSIDEMNEQFEDIDLTTLTKYKTDVHVVKQDTLVTALSVYDMVEHKEDEQNILILNCACAERPGGGVNKGRNGQEENLSRKTSYYMFINEKTEKMFYPLDAEDMLITERVAIVKDENHERIPLDNLKFFDILAIASIRRPGKYTDEAGEEKFSEESDETLARDKIESIFKVGIVGEYDSLVLGAIGCNAYKNPVHTIRDIFSEMIEKYGAYFKHIYIAIRSYNDNNTYDVFKELEKVSDVSDDKQIY